MILTILLVWWLIFGLLGYQLGKERTIGASGGLALGVLLGVIGIIIILFSSKAVSDNDWENNYDLDKQIADSYNKINDGALKEVTAADELKKWHDLKVAGAITDQEFEEKKKGLIKK